MAVHEIVNCSGKGLWRKEKKEILGEKTSCLEEGTRVKGGKAFFH